MSSLDHAERNVETRAELERLASELSEAELEIGVGGGWTVATVFAHLAFWDRMWLRRWRAALANGTVVGRDPVITDDMLNDVVEPLLAGVAPAVAVRVALEAAAALDALIATLPASAVEETRAAGDVHLTDRSGHRREHIEQVRAALR